MANSIIQDPFGMEWPLGFVQVANNGTPVNVMKNVDPNNNNAPQTSTGIPGSGVRAAEYAPTCHKLWIWGMKPGNNNNGMVANSGLVYVLRALGPGNSNSGGAGNRSDSGSIIGIVYPGSFLQIPAQEMDGPTISPYRYALDVDVDGEGALCVAVNCTRG